MFYFEILSFEMVQDQGEMLILKIWNWTTNFFFIGISKTFKSEKFRISLLQMFLP